MEKISPEKAIELSKKQKRFIADTNPFYLTTSCFLEERNGEEIIFDKDVTDGEIKPLFLPKKEENIAGASISYAFEEDIKLLEEKNFEIKSKEFFGDEYIYKTEGCVLLEGPRFKSYRNIIKKFKKTYDYKVFEDYPKEKIIRFLKIWSAQKNIDKLSESSKNNFRIELGLDILWIDLFDKIPNKRIFIEIEGELAGFAVFLKLHENLWISLIQKANFKYDGLTKFLIHSQAIEMKEIEFFSTGNPGDDENLTYFKESMHPVRKIPTYVLEIGKKK